MRSIPDLIEPHLSALSLVLLLLGASVLAVVLFRRLGLPPVLGYLAVGSIIGPHALNLMSDIHRVEYLAEFGVVFLMFSIGLEFSLPKLHAMRRIVFGLGLLQVVLTLLLVMVLVFGKTVSGAKRWLHLTSNKIGAPGLRASTSWANSTI